MRMGWLAAFVSTPVMRGFIEGLVYVTIIGQVPHLLGVPGASGNFFTKLASVFEHLPDLALAPVLTGLFSLAAMLLLRHFAPSVPAALVVMVVATAIIGLLGGEGAGVHVAGHIPSGLPTLTLPHFDASILQELAPGALAIVLIGYAESLAAAKAAAIESGGDIDPNQELVAYGPANILSGLFGGFLVVGSLSKTSVAMAAGARSQFANLVAALFSLLTLLFLTPLFRNMPPAGAGRDCYRGHASSHKTALFARSVLPKSVVLEAMTADQRITARGVKQTLIGSAAVSAFDPKRTCETKAS